MTMPRRIVEHVTEATATAALEKWQAGVSYETIRGVESRQSALLPNGRRLRGIEVAPGLYLARDRRFYATSTDQPYVAQPVDSAFVLAHVSLSAIKYEIDAKLRAHAHRIEQRRAAQRNLFANRDKQRRG